MTWSYSGDPSSSDKDAVRFLVGDTDSTDELVSDEEISYSVTQQGSATMAAVSICRSIAAKFARKADKSVGDLNISYSQKYDHYLALADSLVESATNPLMGSISPRPFAGGISVSDKDTREEDPDRVQPIFRRGMHDNPSETADEATDDEE